MYFHNLNVTVKYNQFRSLTECYPRMSLIWNQFTPALSEQVLEVIKEFGFEKATPVQASCIPLLSNNKDVVVQVNRFPLTLLFSKKLKKTFFKIMVQKFLHGSCFCCVVCSRSNSWVGLRLSAVQILESKFSYPLTQCLKVFVSGGLNRENKFSQKKLRNDFSQWKSEIILATLLQNSISILRQMFLRLCDTTFTTTSRNFNRQSFKKLRFYSLHAACSCCSLDLPFCSFCWFEWLHYVEPYLTRLCC